MFVEAVFKSTFGHGFSYVLFVTVVTLYHVNNVFGVAVNVMINKINKIYKIQDLAGQILKIQDLAGQILKIQDLTTHTIINSP